MAFANGGVDNYLVKYHQTGIYLDRRFGGTGNDDFNDMVIKMVTYTPWATQTEISALRLTRVVKIFLSQSLTSITQKSGMYVMGIW